MDIVNADNLSFSYKGDRHAHPVLKNLRLRVEAGETVGIVGCNGVGKSTLLRLLVGMEPDYTGELSVCGMTVNKRNLKDIRKKAGYVFQDSESQLFMNTVREDVCFAPINYGMTKEEAMRCVMDALERVHMAEQADRKIYQLSGGQKKLAAIATVLVMEPEVLIMDEPSVALDPVNRENLIDVLNALSTTKMIAGHDLDFIYDTCERTVILYDGAIAGDGRTTELLQDEELLRRYGLRLPLSLRRQSM